MELMIAQFRGRVTVSHAALVLALIGGAAPALAQEAPVEASAAASEPAAKFDILGFHITGNTVLPPDTVERAVFPHTGLGRTEADVEAARSALQQAFEAQGYTTVAVVIPEQSVGSGMIRLEVQPQRVGQLRVEGGTRTSEEWVRTRAPSLAPGSTPNANEMQRDIMALNQSADRKVTPEVVAGDAPGTIDVVLKVEDRSPFHASVELNNFSSAATTDLRASATLRYDDLWGRGDSISISAQTAPRRTSDGTVFSANYLTRLGKVQFLGYYVHSDSDIAVIGGTSVIGKGDLAGIRFIVPLGQSDGFYHSLTFGADYKNFLEDLRLGPDRSSIPIEYVPLNIAWRGDWSSDRIKANLGLTAVLGTRGIGTGGGASLDGCVEDVDHFDCKRYKAEPNFFALKLDASLTADIWRDFQLYYHPTAQWSPNPLISNEGFSIGGMDTVRGYFESEALADYGIAWQTELRSPPLAPLLGDFVDELRVHAFLDWGIGGIHHPLIGQKDSWRFMSIGGGARIKLFKHLGGAIDVGVPVRSGPDTRSGQVFARFRIQGEF